MQMAGLTTAEDEVLFDLDDLYRLYLSLVKRVRLVLYLMEIYIHKIYASDIAVPSSPVVQLHGLQVGSSRELSRARHVLRYFALYMLRTDRYIEVVQDVKCLDDCIKTRSPYRRCCLEKCSTHKS